MLKKLKNPLTRLWIEQIVKHDDREAAAELQKALVDFGQDLDVDGIVGPLTIQAIKRTNNSKLAKYILNSRQKTKPPKDAPKWVRIAYKELGVKEIPGKNKSNPRVEQYHNFVGLPWAEDDVPWCGSFMGFVMMKAGFKLPEHPYRALDWLNWGQETPANIPSYGAVAVKKRKGGGHVTLVVGISVDGNHVFCLGGNQNDAVTIAKYATTSFVSYRMPEGTRLNTNIPIMDHAPVVLSEA
jgi:uncharacterized protein (TIGR02594 family)